MLAGRGRTSGTQILWLLEDWGDQPSCFVQVVGMEGLWAASRRWAQESGGELPANCTESTCEKGLKILPGAGMTRKMNCVATHPCTFKPLRMVLCQWCRGGNVGTRFARWCLANEDEIWPKQEAGVSGAWRNRRDQGGMPVSYQGKLCINVKGCGGPRHVVGACCRLMFG